MTKNRGRGKEKEKTYLEWSTQEQMLSLRVKKLSQRGDQFEYLSLSSYSPAQKEPSTCREGSRNICWLNVRTERGLSERPLCQKV